MNKQRTTKDMYRKNKGKATERTGKATRKAQEKHEKDKSKTQNIYEKHSANMRPA